MTVVEEAKTMGQTGVRAEMIQGQVQHQDRVRGVEYEPRRMWMCRCPMKRSLENSRNGGKGACQTVRQGCRKPQPHTLPATGLV